VEILYPLRAPDSTPLQFLPGIVTSNNLDFNSAYSPDGQSFYFGRSENGKWVMYVTTFHGKHWSPPIHPAFSNTKYSEADPAFAPDGSLYFISTRPRDVNDTTSDYDIWKVCETNEGWSEPENFAIINSDSNEFYISFAPNGNLYFSSARMGGYGKEDIYVSILKNGKSYEPVNLGSAVNSTGSDHDPLIIGDEEYLLYSSSDRPDSYGQADFYFSTRINPKEWSAATNLGVIFNTPTYEYCPYLSPDNKYFFYSSQSDVKWIKAEYLYRRLHGITGN
jgi:Tol biopolymer transport system component